MPRAPETLVIKRSKKKTHFHHAGAWKIAYADFVTAMMAFFLLLWLISMTTPEQKQGLANYFAPPNISESTSGSGGILAGRAVDSEGKMNSSAYNGGDRNAGVMDMPSREKSIGGKSDADAARKASPVDLSSQNPQNFQSAAISIRQAWQSLPDITEISDNLIVQVDRDGLNIELLNQKGRQMFDAGGTYPYDWVREAIAAIAPVLDKLPNQIRISGHTRAGETRNDPKYDGWQLTSDRANAVRTLLGEFGLSNERIYAVEGRADTEPFFADNPYLAANERVQITVLASPPPLPLDAQL